MNIELNYIQNLINNFKEKNPNESVGELSDTYHSFNDLYKHRTILSALLFLNLPYSWKAKVHEDGTMFDGMFITGFPTPTGMISYHYDLEYWNLFKVPELPRAPKFTGYTEQDVLNRFINIIMNSTSRIYSKEDWQKISEIVINEIFPVIGSDITKRALFISFFDKIKRDMT